MPKETRQGYQRTGEPALNWGVRMRLAICVRQLSFGDGVGGLERAAADHIRMMISAGYSIRLFAPKKRVFGSVPDEVEVIDVPWPSWDVKRAFSTFGLAYVSWCKRLADTLVRHQIAGELLHLHGASAGAIPRLRAAGLQNPIVVNPHGMEEFGRFDILRFPNRLFLKRLVKMACGSDAVVATDTSLVPAVMRNIGIDRGKVVVIPNSVDEVRLKSGLKSQSALRHLDLNMFTMVTVGRLVHNKGYDLLLDALKTKLVRASLPSEYQWLHLGSGPEASRLSRMAASDPLVPLKILGGKSDEFVQSTLAQADIFVQPSRYEGSSLTTLEAMLHGRIVIGTAVGGIPDKILDGQTGFLAPQASVNGLSTAILRALKADPSVGRQAQDMVRTHFSSGSSKQLYHELYSQLAFADPSNEAAEV